MAESPLKSENGREDTSNGQVCESIEKILLEEIDLAKGGELGGLGYLEFQAPRIADRIASYLGLLGG